MSIKSLKTPLRYPGGKSKAIKTLSQWYPKNISEYREPCNPNPFPTATDGLPEKNADSSKPR